MRRTDRELTDMAQIMEIIGRENVCCVAFHDEPCPYLVPMNYGAECRKGQLTLYFHGAAEGTKLSLLKKNPAVSFTVVSGAKNRLVKENACQSYASFESVCGSGTAELAAEPEEKRHGLTVLMNQAGRPEGLEFSEASFGEGALAATAVWKITVETIVGKRHE